MVLPLFFFFLTTMRPIMSQIMALTSFWFWMIQEIRRADVNSQWILAEHQINLCNHMPIEISKLFFIASYYSLHWLVHDFLPPFSLSPLPLTHLSLISGLSHLKIVLQSANIDSSWLLPSPLLLPLSPQSPFPWPLNTRISQDLS